MVYAIDFNTGKIVWEHEAHRGIPPQARHLKNTYASETPVTDGQRVYVSFGNVGAFAYDFNGKLLWSSPVQVKPTRYGWGTAASPVLHNGRLYIVNDNDAGSSLTAIDAATGKTIWLVERKEGTNWATPYIWQHGGGTEIVTAGTGAIRSYNLDGELLWSLSPMSTHRDPDAVLEVRSPLRRIRVCWRSGEAGVCDQTGRERRHLAEARRNLERVDRLVAAARRTVQSIADRLRRLLLHAVRSRVLHGARCAAPEKRSTRRCVSIPRRVPLPRHRGPTTASCSR